MNSPIGSATNRWTLWAWSIRTYKLTAMTASGCVCCLCLCDLEKIRRCFGRGDKLGHDAHHMSKQPRKKNTYWISIPPTGEMQITKRRLRYLDYSTSKVIALKVFPGKSDDTIMQSDSAMHLRLSCFRDRSPAQLPDFSLIDAYICARKRQLFALFHNLMLMT